MHGSQSSACTKGRCTGRGVLCVWVRRERTIRGRSTPALSVRFGRMHRMKCVCVEARSESSESSSALNRLHNVAPLFSDRPDEPRPAFLTSFLPSLPSLVRLWKREATRGDEDDL